MKNKPPYAIESVDNALRILQALRDSGQVRGEDSRSEQGITNRTSGEEKSRQQKVAPIRAESGKNRNKKRAS